MSESEEQAIAREAEKLRKWLTSDEGREAMQRVSRKSAEAAAKRAEARRVDPRQLDKPVTF